MVATKRVLVVAAIAEIATGVGLLLVPSTLGQLLLGTAFTGLVVTVARLAGIALISLGVACWPGTPLAGMLIYNAGAAVYLAYLGLADRLIGPLLWPAVILHAILAVLLAVGLSR